MEYVVQNYVVCLIDLLDQKRRLKGWAKPPYDRPEAKRALADTVGRVEIMRKHFHDFFMSFDTPTISDEQLRDDDGEAKVRAFHRVREFELNPGHFSDTLLFYSPVRNCHDDLSAAGLFRMLAAASSAMQTALMRNWPVRGSISHGAGTLFESGGIYGPAIADAYYLESEVAEYPRVVVSDSIPRLLQHIRNEDTSRGSHVLASRKLAEMCKSLICRDDDNAFIVDYLGEGFRDLLGGEAPRREVDAIRKFAKTESERFGAAGNRKLGPRYQRLMQYVESRLPVWKHSGHSRD